MRQEMVMILSEEQWEKIQSDLKDKKIDIARIKDITESSYSNEEKILIIKVMCIEIEKRE